MIESPRAPVVHHTPLRTFAASFADLIRLRSQSGTWLLLLPSLWAIVLANGGHPPLSLVTIFVAGSFVMRSLGVILNDLADRKFDRQVTRTRMRPLASGALGLREAAWMAAVLLVAATGLVFFLNPLAILLSPIAVVLAAAYPYAKRIIPIPQAVLGIAFGWGTVMAWAASRNTVEGPGWALFGATICWAIAYDTIYALQDRADDRRIGVKSAAVLFGAHVWLAVGTCLTTMLGLLSLAGYLCAVRPLYYGILAVVGLCFVVQVLRLRRPIPPDVAFALFKQHVWAGTIILLGIWASVW
ncbi:MAG: 4-hydroxybenzoate octaprenyltransferase [Nitrospiraceae bacterium]